MAYGEYANSGRCLGKCLYQLSKMGMPLHIVETIVFGNTHNIEYCKKPFASYQWLEDDTPVFTFDPSYESAVTYTAMQLEWFKRYQPAALEFIQTEIKPAEMRTAKDFLDKWASPGIAVTFGEYWTKTPSRLYWCMAYELSETRLRECAQDLLNVSAAGEWNTSVLHARNLVSSYIGRD
jgi:hypothetical protein